MAAAAAQPAITIPAGYLEDVRTALAVEIHNGSDWLTRGQGDVVSADPDCIESRREDRDGALRAVRQDVDALDQLREATGDTELTADAETLWHMLQALGTSLADRLRGEFEFGPVDMDAVLELTVRLRWAATEANRIREAM